MDQDRTWHGGGSRSRPHCVVLGPSSPLQKGDRSPPIFGLFLLWSYGWMHQDALGTEAGLSPGDIVLDGDPAPPKGHSPPIFGPCLLWPKSCVYQDTTWYGSRRSRVGLSPGDIALDGDPAPPEKGTPPVPHSIFGPCPL